MYPRSNKDLEEGNFGKYTSMCRKKIAILSLRRALHKVVLYLRLRKYTDLFKDFPNSCIVIYI